MRLNGKIKTKMWIVVLAVLAPMIWMQTAIADETTCRMITELDQDGDGLVSMAEFPGPDAHFNWLDKNQDGYIENAEALQFRPGMGKGRMAGGFIARWDADGDGVVTRDEFSGIDDHFTQLDQNSDGLVDETEAAVLGKRQGHRMGARAMHRLDADGNGLISLAEFGGSEDIFNRLDTDGNGYIDQNECPGRNLREGKLGGMVLEQMDTDGDGAVSAEEFAAAHEGRFNALDQDGNGQIDASEMPVKRPMHRFGAFGSEPDQVMKFGPGGTMNRSGGRGKQTVNPFNTF